MIDRRLWHPLTGNYVLAGPGVWLFAPTDDSIRKVIYMSVREIAKKWTMPVHDWGLAYQQFAIWFEDRIAS